MCAALGKVARADEARAELLARVDQATLPERQAALRERDKPVQTAALRRVVVDFALVDGMLPGRRTV